MAEFEDVYLDPTVDPTKLTDNTDLNGDIEKEGTGLVPMEEDVADFSDVTPDEEAAAVEAMSSESLVAPSLGTPDLALYGDQTPYDLGEEESDFKAIFPEQMLDLYEHRAANQSTAQKWGRGATKFLGKTLVNAAGGTAGVIYGFGAMAATKEGSAFWNNDFAHWLDDLNEEMDNELMHYYSRAEREKGLLGRAMTANFWSDKFLNGMSFLAGAALTGWGTGLVLKGLGMAKTAAAARLFKKLNYERALTFLPKTPGALKNSATFDAMEAAFKNMQFGNAMKNTGGLVARLSTGAGYEAGVEARHTYESMQDVYMEKVLGNRIQKREQALGRSLTKEEKLKMLTPEEKLRMDNETTSIANWVFAGNFGLVGISNILMLPKLYGVGLNNSILNLPSRLARFAGEKVGLAPKIKGVPNPFNIMDKVIGKTAGDITRGTGRVLGTGFYEGVVEEGGQGVMSKMGVDYASISALRENESENILRTTFDLLKENAKEQVSDVEGQEEIAIGFLLGILGLPGPSMTAVRIYKDVAQNRALMEKVREMTKKNPDLINSLRQNHTFFSNVVKRSEELYNAAKEGNMAKAKDLEFDDFFDYVYTKVATGQFEDIADEAKLIEAMSNEQFRELGGYSEAILPDDEVAARKAEVIKNVKDRAKLIKEKINKVDNMLKLTREEQLLDDGSPASKGYLRRQLIHLLSVSDNSDERENKLIKEVAKLTNGHIKQVTDQIDQIVYTDEDGNERTLDIGSWEANAPLEDYIARLQYNVDLLKAQERDLTEEDQKQLDERRAQIEKLEALRENREGDATLTEQEYNEILKPAQELEDWKQMDPESYMKNEDKVVEYMNDIRHLRARRQKALEAYKLLADESTRKAEIARLVKKHTDIKDLQEKEKKLTEKAQEKFEEENKKLQEENEKKRKEYLAKIQKAKQLRLNDLKELEKELAEYQEEVDRLMNEIEAVLNTEPDSRGVIRLRYTEGERKGQFMSREDAKRLWDKYEEAAEFIDAYEKHIEDLRKDRRNLRDVITILEKLEETPMPASMVEAAAQEQLMLAAEKLGTFSEFEPGMNMLKAMREVEGHMKFLISEDERMAGEEAKLQKKVNELKEMRGEMWRLLNALDEDVSDWSLEDKEALHQKLVLNRERLDKAKAAVNAIRGKRAALIGEYFNFQQMKDAAALYSTYQAMISKAIDTVDIVESKKEATDKQEKPKASSTEEAEIAHQKDQEARIKTNRKPSEFKKPHIKDVGYFKTTGLHTSESKEYEGALETYKRLSEPNALTDEEVLELENAHSQLRWFTYLQGGKEWIRYEGTNDYKEIQEGSPFRSQNPDDPSSLKMVLVTSDRIPPELENDLTPDMFKDTEQGKDIKVVLYREKHAVSTTTKKKGKNSTTSKSVDVNDFVRVGPKENRQIVYTSLMLPKLKGSKMGDPFNRFNVEGVSPAEQERIRNGYELWRDKVLAILESGDNPMVRITGKSLGTIQFDQTLEELASMEGRLLGNSKGLKNVKLMVAKEVEVEEGQERPDTTAVRPYEGLPAIMLREGMVAAYDHVRHMTIPVHSRKLDTFQADNVMRMMHLLLKEKDQQIKENPEKKPGDVWKDIKRSFTVNVSGTDINVWDTLNKMVYISKKRHKHPELSFGYNKYGQFEFGADGVTVDLKTFTDESEENSKKLEALKAFLLNKYHQVDAKAVDAAVKQSTKTFGKQTYKYPKWYSSGEKFAEIHLTEDLTVADTSILYDNYNEYLLKDRPGDRKSPLGTRVTPISNLERIDTPRVLGGYYQFSSDTIGTLQSKNKTAPRRRSGVSKADPTEGSSTSLNTIWKQAGEKRPESISDRHPLPKNASQHQLSAEQVEEQRKRQKPLSEEETKVLSDSLLGKKKPADEGKPKDPPANPFEAGRPMMDLYAPVLGKGYIEETYAEELARVQQMSKIEIIETGNRIRYMGRYAIAQLDGLGKVLLDKDIRIGGVLYHETFHNISLFFLSPQESAAMYERVRKGKGSITTYLGETKKLSELTDDEAEEFLAEEFRRYVLSEKDYVIGQDTVTPEYRGPIQRFFDSIINWFRMRFGLDRNLEFSALMRPEMELFKKIVRGDMLEAMPDPRRDWGQTAPMLASMALGEEGVVYSKALMSTITKYMAEVITDPETNISFEELLNFSSEESTEIGKRMKQAYDEALNRMWMDYQVAYTEAEDHDKPDVLRRAAVVWPDLGIAEGTEEGRKRRNDIFRLHQQFMYHSGLSTEVEDEREEHGRASRQWADDKEQMEISPTQRASRRIRLLLSTLPNYEEKNATGLYGVYELSETLKTLQNELQGKIEYTDQIATMEALTGKYPWMQEVLNRLGKYDPSSEADSIEQVLMRTQFGRQFAQPFIETRHTLLGEDGRIGSLDPNLERAFRGIRFEWSSKLRLKASQKEQGHVSYTPTGSVVFQAAKKFKHKGAYTTLEALKKSTANTKTLGPVLDALEAFGIEFSNKDAVAQNASRLVPGTDHTYSEALRDALRYTLVDILKSNFRTIGGFDTAGKGSIQGDGKDKKMREVASGFIGELTEPPRSDKYYKPNSSTGTSWKYFAKKLGDSNYGGNMGNTVEAWIPRGTVMLARNGKLKGLPLSEITKERIMLASAKGAKFVVGDMPEVDSQFIEYLTEIGADFTVYHAGKNPRIAKSRTGLKASLFDRSNSESVGRMNRLARIELETGERVHEFQHQNAEGKLEYGITMNTYITTIANTPYELLSKYYDPLNEPFTENSLAIDAWIEGSPFEVVNLGGLQIDRPGETGSKPAKLKKTDLIINHVQAIMEGLAISPRAADQRTEFGVRFNIKHGKTIDSVDSILKGYLEDEIASAVKYNFEGQYLKTVSETDENGNIVRGKDLRKFRAMMDSDMHERIRTELIENEDIYNQLKEEDEELRRMTIKEFLDENWNGVINKQVKDTLRREVDSTVKYFERHGLIGKPEKDGTRFLYGLSRDWFQDPDEQIYPEKASEDHIRQFAEEFVVKQFIGNTEYFKIFLGDPVLYSDLYKRVKGTYGTKHNLDVSPGLNKWFEKTTDLARTDGKVDMIIAKEPTDLRLAKELANFEKYPKEVRKMYKDAIDLADGTMFVTLDVAREMAIRAGNWLSEQEDAYNDILAYREEKLKKIPQGTFRAFPPMKYQYFGPQEWADGLIQPKGFLKMSMVPVYPEMAEMGDKTFPGITAMQELMEKHRAGGIVLPSAFKVGVTRKNIEGESTPPQAEFHGENGTIDVNAEVSEKAMTTFDYRFMGEQLPVAPKFKGKAPIGTQARVQVLSDLFENGKLRYDSLNEAVHEYNKLMNGITEKAFMELLNEFNMVEEDGMYRLKQNDYTRFLDVLKQEGIRRELSESLLDGLEELQKMNDNGDPVLFDLLVNKRRMEGLLWSLAGKRVIRQKFKGDMMVQRSMLGFEVVKQGKLPPKYDPLKFYMDGKDLVMEVYMPHHFKEFVGEDVEIRDGGIWSNGVKVGGENLLNMIGIRIPTDGTHSIEMIKVKGFLPQDAGPQVVVPSELLIKAGSDFDIDKLLMYFPAYEVEFKDGKKKLKKIPFKHNMEEWWKAEHTRVTEHMAYLKSQIDRGHFGSAAVARNLESEQTSTESLYRALDAFTSNIWGEDAFDPEDLKTFTEAEDIIALSQALMKDPKVVERMYNDAVAAYSKIGNSFEEWEDLNPGMNKYNINSKGAIQNEIMKHMVKLLKNKNRLGTYMQPVHMDDWTALAKDIQDKTGAVDLGDVSDYYEANTFTKLMDVTDAFFQAGTVVGIAALASTHQVKAQQANLKLNLKDENGDVLEYVAPHNVKLPMQIRFEGFNNSKKNLSLSRLKDVKGQRRISDAISQLVNVAVDAVNNPILHLINMGPDFAPTGLFMLRAGVPMDNVAYFLNQPIVKDYMEMMNVQTSRAWRALEKQGNEESIIKHLLNRKYETGATTPIGDTLFEGSELFDMMGMDVSEMGEVEKMHQQQILEDFLLYKAMGEELGSLTTAQSFDTSIPKGRNHLRIVLQRYQDALDSGYFTNAEQITEGDTFLRSMTDFNKKMSGVFNSISLTEQADKAYIQGFQDMVEVFTDKRKTKLSDDDRVRILNQYEEGFVSFLIQRLKTTDQLEIGKEAQHLLYGDNTMAMKLTRVQAGTEKGLEDIQDNIFIQSLIPVVAVDTANEQNDYIQPAFRTMNSYEAATLFDSFKELEALHPEFARDIILTAFLQTGIGQAPQSFLELIPGSSFMKIGKNILVRYVKDPESEAVKAASAEYFEEFFKNNMHDERIVPRENRPEGKKSPNDKRRLIYPYTQRETKESASARKLARKNGMPVPKRITNLYRNVYYSSSAEAAGVNPRNVESERVLVEEGKRSRTHLNFAKEQMNTFRLPNLNPPTEFC